MKLEEIRNRFLRFFQEREHTLVKSDSLIPHNDPSVLFTGAGMNQFKEYFLGLKKDFTRAASCQKCLRTGDLDNVGKTAYHHTFFEMLGNFSFGDYFKKEAIAWAWEFMTNELEIPKERLRVSVHNSDTESLDIWKNDIGLSEDIIYSFGDKDNFWPSNAPKDGPNGPCGPCSEIFYDQGAECGCKKPECSPACDCGRFAEVWNLVFTQYERKPDGTLEPLPSKNIDTGMGLERIACVLQGKNTNYEIDVFDDVLHVIRAEADTCKKADEINASLYAIADHMRACVFSIADGAYPSNEGRGYVIRKLLRRSVWHARLIGIQKPFLFKLVPVFVRVFKSAYPELAEHETYITEVVTIEEKRFLNTLEEGLVLLERLIAELKRGNKSQLPGNEVFKLYDTYGFPDELTRIIAEKEGLKIDQAGFRTEMERQRERAQQSTKISSDIFTSSELEKMLVTCPPTIFSGYTRVSDEAKVIALLHQNVLVDTIDDVKSHCIVVCDRTPCYAESGGQVGDRGTMSNSSMDAQIVDTQKKDDVYYHLVQIEKGFMKKGDTVCIAVDKERRTRIMKNHTATHLLQAALRETLGEQVRQLGSLVSDEKLRFDFSFQRALSAEEKTRIEILVNQKINEKIAVSTKEMTIDEAKKAGALAFFGDKYSDTVRLVGCESFSKELCGGTHVENTKEIAQFVIVSESSSASGIRRIEAVTGEAAHMYTKQEQEKHAEEQRNLEQKEKSKAEKARIIAQYKSTPFIDKLLSDAQKMGSCNYVYGVVQDVGQGGLREIYDVLKTKIDHAIISLLSEENDKISIFIALTKDLEKSTISAGDLVKKIGKVMQCRGGGKKQMAFAGIQGTADTATIMKMIQSIVTDSIQK